MTKREEKLVFVLLDELIGNPQYNLQSMVGSIGELQLMELHHKLKYRDFCKARGISVKHMTEEDYELYYELRERERMEDYASSDF